MKKTLLLLTGLIALTGAFGCSSNPPSTPPENSASQQPAESEGSATSPDEAGPDEGSGN